MAEGMTITYLAFGFAFLLGLGLVLRPGVILRFSLLNGVFLALIGIFLLSAWRIMGELSFENGLTLGIGFACVALGGLIGWRLRRWERRPRD